MVKLRNIFLMTLVIVMCFTIPAFAAETTYDLSVNGDNSVIATFNDETGVLTISGSGATKDYTSSSSTRTPLYSILTSVKSVVVEDGVTALGDYLLYYNSSYCLNTCTSVSLPTTLTSIGDNNFNGATYVSSFSCPADVELGENALSSYSSTRYMLGCSVSSGKTATVHANDIYMKETLEALGYSVTTTGSQTVDKFDSYPAEYKIEIGANGDNVIAYVNPFLNKIDIKGSGATKDYGQYATPLSSYLLKLTELNIDEGITYLGDNLFSYFYSSTQNYLKVLTSVNLPSTLTEIGDRTFYQAGIQNIVIPANVTAIGSEAFGGLNSPSGTGSTITFESGSKLESIGSKAFYYTDGSQIILPDGLKTIGDYAFNGCTGYTKVYIPASVTSIGEKAFSGDTKVADFTCLSTNLTLGTDAFGSGNSAMGYSASNKVATVDASNAYLKNGLEAMGYTVSTVGTAGDRFNNWPAEYVYNLGDNVKGYFNEYTGELIITGTGTTRDCYIGNTMYESSSGMEYTPIGVTLSDVTSLIVEEGVTTLGDNVLYYSWGQSSGHSGSNYLSNCTSVSLPSTLTSIGANNFYALKATSVEIPANVTEIGEAAFKSSKSTSVILESGSKLETIGDSAFESASLTSIDLPDSVTTIGERAFYYSKLTSVNIPAGVSEIGEEAFRQSSLASVSISEGVTSIGVGAFRSTALTSVDIPDSVETIGDYAFESTNITSLDIPDGVTTIGKSAFSDCRKLTEVIIPESVESIGDSAFYNAGYSTSGITIKNYADDVQTIGTGAFKTSKSNTTVYQYQANTAMTTALSESTAAPVAVYYFDDIVLSGDLDNGIHWEYDPDTKILTFTGNGDIPDYTDGSQPWYGAATQYGGIGTYKFGDGITGIGNGVFGSYGNSAYGANGSGATAYGPAGLSYGGATYSGTVSGGAGGGGGSTGGEGGSGGGSGASGSTGDGSDESTTLPKDEETMIILDAQPTNFMVTVPIAINAVMDGEGNVTTGDGYYVENACAWGPVVIKDIVVVAETNWDLADWNSDFANMKASTKKLAMTINGVEVAVTGAVSMNDSLSSVIKYQDKKELTFELRLPAQKVALQENIAAVVFTVDFDKV